MSLSPTSGAAPSPDAATPVRHCRCCGGADLVPVLDLGLQAACDAFPAAGDPWPDPAWPLALVHCTRCHLLQLDHVSPVPEPPRAVESATMLAHAGTVSDAVIRHAGLTPGATFVEFASHHGGHWAGALAEAGLRELDQLDGEPADLVLDNHGLVHEEDLTAAVATRASQLAEDGVLAVEFHHALAMVEGGQFDAVRHGHPVYLSLHAWSHVCARAGLAVTDVWTEDVYGGCLVVLARPVREGAPAPTVAPSVSQMLQREEAAGLTGPHGYGALARAATEARTALQAYLRAATVEGRTVLGYGAGSKAGTFLGACGIGRDLLAAIADASPDKQGRRLPGVGIPIISPADLIAAAPAEVLVLTWDIAAEVVRQLRRDGLTDATYTIAMPTLARAD